MSKANNIKIINAILMDPKNDLDDEGTIYIENGKLVNIQVSGNKKKSSDAKSFNEQNFIADQTIDARGGIVCPSFFDLNAHLREPGFERKATLESELFAAVSGGVGHVACLPSCEPTIDTSAVATLIIDRAKELDLASAYPIGALTLGMEGKQLSEMQSLNEAGCLALTNYYNEIEDLSILRHCYEYAANFDIPIFIFPQNPSLAKQGCAHEGEIASILGLKGIPEIAETVAISTHLLLIEQTGVRAHFAQLSTGRGLDLIEDAQQAGMNVSADVTINHLHLSEKNLENYDSLFHLQPPLRTNEDKNRLIEGVAKGSVSAICSSHQPHEEAAKFLPFASADPGISGIETLLSLAGKLVDENHFSLTTMIDRMVYGPAKILGIDREGLKEGKKADLCIFNKDSKWNFSPDEMNSAGKNSPYFKETFQYRVSHTIINGRIVFQLN